MKEMCRKHYFGQWPQGNPCSVCGFEGRFIPTEKEKLSPFTTQKGS